MYFVPADRLAIHSMARNLSLRIALPMFQAFLNWIDPGTFSPTRR
jgi:hypothetical protein